MIGNFEPEENVMNRWEVKPDIVIDFQDHLKRGNVWRVEIELEMQDTPGDDYTFYRVEVHVVAPTRDLASYIVSTMYPDYESLSVDDHPMQPELEYS